MTITIFKPIGANRDRLIENVGRDTWRYNGVPEKGWVRHSLGGVIRKIEVWFYDFDKIADADIQQQMIRSRAASHGISLAEAESFLRSHQSATPCADVELVQVPEHIQ